jgi:hypothetical protein
MAIVVPVHYAIGITLALGYLFVSSAAGLSPRKPITALGFALCTNLLPWLIMFPAMGYGWFGAHGPVGTRLLLSSLATHWFYGLGLWLGASILSRSAHGLQPAPAIFPNIIGAKAGLLVVPNKQEGK